MTDQTYPSGELDARHPMLEGVPVMIGENMIRTLTPALIEFVTQNPEVVEYVFATNRE